MITASPYAYMKYFKYYGLADEVIGTEFFMKIQDIKINSLEKTVRELKN